MGKGIRVLMFVIIMLSAGASFAGDVNLNLGYESTASNQHELGGGTDQIIYGGDDLITGRISGDGSFEPQAEGGNYIIGFSAFISEYYQIYSVPVSYKISDRLKLAASFPLVRRTVEHEGKKYSKAGLGDISVGFGWLAFSNTDSESVTSFSVTLPTGDAEAEDGGYAVPLGSGGYSFFLSQSLIYRLGQSAFTVLGEAGLRYFTDTKYKIFNTEEELRRGNQLFAMGGLQHQTTDKLRLNSKLKYTYVAEGESRLAGQGWKDSGDAVNALDLILSGTYKAYSKYWIELGVVIPVATGYDNSVDDEEDRSIGFTASVYTRF